MSETAPALPAERSGSSAVQLAAQLDQQTVHAAGQAVPFRSRRPSRGPRARPRRPQ